MTKRLGTLGSAFTFAGQATAALRAQRPDMGEPTYFETMDDVVAAVLEGKVDVGVLTSETSHTACTETAARILAGEALFIAHEILVPYRCALLGKPGTRLADIRHVGGHGSIRQCQRFLRERLPNVPAEVHRQNSVVAAQEVLAGDGTTSVIGTEAVARELGLEIIEAVVDGGAVGGWWGLTAELERPEGADMMALRLDGADELHEVWSRLGDHGLRVRTVTNAPTGDVHHYRYLLTVHTTTGAPVTDAVIDTFGSGVVGVFASSTAP